MSLTAKPSRRNSGFQTRIAPVPSSDSAIASAVPTGTVDLPATTSPGRRCGLSAAVAALTYVRSARNSPCTCGVPTQMKWTSLPAASAMSVLKLSRPVAPASVEQLRQAGLVERRATLAQRLDLLRVDVDADDVVAQLGHARGVDGTEVAAADDADPHGVLS